MTRPLPATGPGVSATSPYLRHPLRTIEEAERDRDLRQIARLDGQRRAAWLQHDAETEAFYEREIRDLRAKLMREDV